jgi:peptidoglycan L-alanyl-D-glutamate endopeptidase CwlK
MSFQFSSRSLNNLRGVHPDLVKVAKRALQLTDVDFMVIDGIRTLEEQRILVRSGKSRTMRSRHLTGHAIDVVPWGDFDGDGDVDGKDLFDFWPQYKKMAGAFKVAAEELGVDLQWGGDWKTFVDGPHFQLSHRAYPA